MEKITDSNILAATGSWQRESFLNEHASFDKSRFTYIPRGYIPSSRFSRHDLFECYSRNDISSFLRPSTGKASNSGSRTWTLKSWQTREERRRGTSVSTTCRIGRLPSDPYVQPVTCYQSRFRTICPLASPTLHFPRARVLPSSIRICRALHNRNPTVRPIVRD